MHNTRVCKNTVIVTLSYNRPQFLKESVPSLLNNADGTDFCFIVWDNNSNEETRQVLKELQKKYEFGLFLNNENIGQQAYRVLMELDIVKQSDYFVLVEDDMLWFSPDWLKQLINAMELPPAITDKTAESYKREWGILATNVLQDKVTNGGMWNERFKGAVENENQGIRYIANVRTAAGAMIMRTKRMLELNVFGEKTRFQGAVGELSNKYHDAWFMNGHVKDTYIYHGAGPFFNQLYPEVYENFKKDRIEDDFRKYEELGFRFKGNEYILEKLKNGSFKEYANKLWKTYQNI